MTTPESTTSSSAAPTVQTRYTVRVSVGDLVIFDGSVTDKDFFRMEQKEGQSTRVNLSATAAIELAIRAMGGA